MEERQAHLIEAEEHRDRYVQACRTFESLLAIDDDHEQITEQRHQLNQLYERLDRETRSRFAQHYLDLDKRANALQDRLNEQIIQTESSLQRSNEYQTRLNELQQQLDQIEQQLSTLPSSFELFKELKQQLMRIEPELVHLSDQVDDDLRPVQDRFDRLALAIRESFERHKISVGLSTEINENLLHLHNNLEQGEKDFRSSISLDDQHRFEQLIVSEHPTSLSPLSSPPRTSRNVWITARVCMPTLSPCSNNCPRVICERWKNNSIVSINGGCPSE